MWNKIISISLDISMDKNERKLLAIGILGFIVLIVVLFADVIVPTLSSTPIRFDVSQGIDVNVDPSASTGSSGRSCVIYPNDPGC